MQSLKDRRIERGLTIERTIRTLDISRPTYMKYEDNPRLMPLGKYLDLCDLLDVRPWDIFLPETISLIKREEGDGAVDDDG